jgi:hypothetical protein
MRHQGLRTSLRADSSSHLLAAYEVLLAFFILTALLMVNLHQSGAGRRFRMG